MIQAVDSNSSSVLGGTIGAGVVGAGVYGISDLCRQKFLLGNPLAAKGLVKDTFNKALKAESAGKKYLADAFLNVASDLEKIVNTGKINWKMAGKTALTGGLLIGGLYLAYRGIKALFTKNN